MGKLRLGRWQAVTGHISGKLPFGSIFLAGLIAGILMMNIGKSMLLENTGLLDEDTLYHIKYMTVDNQALFGYVLRKRLGRAVCLAILSTTYLGLAVCAGAAFWYGMSAGSFLSALAIRYGLKGILLALAGIFPHYLLYVPALAALLGWCEQVNRGIYFKGYRGGEEGKFFWPGRVLRLIAILVVLLLGCLLEGFCNPGVLLSFLKIF